MCEWPHDWCALHHSWFSLITHFKRLRGGWEPANRLANMFSVTPAVCFCLFIWQRDHISMSEPWWQQRICTPRYPALSGMSLGQLRHNPQLTRGHTLWVATESRTSSVCRLVLQDEHDRGVLLINWITPHTNKPKVISCHLETIFSSTVLDKTHYFTNGVFLLNLSPELMMSLDSVNLCWLKFMGVDKT